MRDIYPKIKPYVTHTLRVEAPHRLYVEECGSPDGIPVLFVHGGPGAGCAPVHRCFFDPEKYRIILFDQRGCGKSTPHASLENNTTQDLVADMEFIRDYLGVEQWLLFGGSWGSTLSLVYAQAHPRRVLGLVLRGIFLCRPHEIRWFYQEGASHIFPDYWEDYLKPIPEAERGDLLKAYYRRLSSENEVARMAAAKAWAKWEGRTSTLHPSKTVIDHFSQPHNALSLARIESHYFSHGSFLEPNQILRDAGRLAGIPGVIVQGRYDVVCPMQSAWDLHRAWPDAVLQIIPDAGHSALEVGIIDALVRATDDMARRLA
ncbi:MAG TPA: prolyl aminopeptidase [Gammaproteobacteria bacterium]|nr:prolyl aminopeptidase [Gammaproteobacteria bacterium]